LIASARPAAIFSIASGRELPVSSLRVVSKATPSRNTVHTAPTGAATAPGSVSEICAVVQARSLPAP